MRSQNSNLAERIDSIQLLRGLAAIAVLTHHIPLFGNGGWGVDIFFVTSGFIIYYVTDKSGDQFMMKRIIRVVPLYWCGTFGVYLISIIAPSLLNSGAASIGDLLKSLFFIPYKKGDFICPLLFLGWTLNYEMFFYVLFAVSMLFSHKWRGTICSLLICLVSLSGAVFNYGSPALAFLSNSIIIEFIFGIIAYAVFRKISAFRSSAVSSFPFRILCSAMALASLAYLPFAYVRMPLGIRAFDLGLPSMFLFISTLVALNGVSLPRSLVLIGDSSYSLYLFHPYLVQSFERGFNPFRTFGIYAYSMAALLIFLCCALSVLSYIYLEKPVTDCLRKAFLKKDGLKGRASIP